MSRLWALFAVAVSASAAAAPARRYADPQRAEKDVRPPVCGRVEALAASLQHGLVADARLSAAADDILARLPASGRPANDLVESALWLHGIVEPAPHLLVASMTPNGEDALFDELRTQLPKAYAQGHFVRLGVAARPVGDEVRLLVALQESHVDLRPVPRALATGTAVLEGQLLDGYRNGGAYVTLPDGSVEHLAVVRGDDAHLLATFRCGRRPGRYQVEVTGEERYGPAVLANFPIWCGVAAPSSLPATAGDAVVAETSVAGAETEMLRQVNRDRARANLPSLAADSALAAVARAHSADMRAHDFVGHVSPTTGSANDRLHAAHIQAQLVLENVARAYSVAEAETGLMGSPGHRANLLHAGVTHIGIGIDIADGIGGRELWVTQVFVKPVDHVDANTGRALLSSFAGVRRQKGLPALLGDDELDEVAKTAAVDMADGQDPARAGGTVDKVLARLGRRFGAVKSVVAVAGSTDQFVIGVQKSLLEAGLTHVGIGVQEGKRKDGSTALYGVFLLATERR